MIVLVIYSIGILAYEAKGDTPIAAYFYCPITLALTAEFMETQTGEVHVLRMGG